jgi:hypothetical protein
MVIKNAYHTQTTTRISIGVMAISNGRSQIDFLIESKPVEQKFWVWESDRRDGGVGNEEISELGTGTWFSA